MEYVAKHANKYLKFREYDYDKSPMENGKVNRNNMLFHIIRERLMDEDTFGARTTPGGFTQASKAARFMRELAFGNPKELAKNGIVDFDGIYQRMESSANDPEPNYDPSDPTTILIYNQQNQVAGKLIGIFANQNINHVFSSLMERMVIKRPISFAGHSYNDLIHAPEGIDVDINMAEFLAASVDAVKDPVLNFLNLNTITANAGAVLARLGYTSTEIGLLFNQPVIRELCDICFNEDQTVEIGIKTLLKKYKIDSNTIKPLTEQESSINRLALNIINNEIDESQFGILSLFNDIYKTANEVTQFIASTKFTASNSVGSTFGELYAQQIKVANYISRIHKNSKDLALDIVVHKNIVSPVSNDTNLKGTSQEYIESIINNPLAYEQAMYDMNRKMLSHLNQWYPYDTEVYTNARNRLVGLSNSGYIDADTINSMHSDILVYMLSQREHSLFNGNYQKNGLSAREYFTKQFPLDLFSKISKNKTLKEMPIFKYMKFGNDSFTGETGISMENIGGLHSYQEQAIIESWEELLSIDPELANDLQMYNFYKMGFSFGPFGFGSLTPTSLKVSTIVDSKHSADANNGEGGYVAQTYPEFLREVLDGLVKIDVERFLQQYILNHLDNYRLVYTVHKSNPDYKALKERAIIDGKYAREFVLDTAELKNDAKSFLIKDASLNDKETAFKPCIIIDNVVYMASGDTNRFNISSGSSITYRRVNALGKKNVAVQYLSPEVSSINNIEVDSESTTGDTSRIYDETSANTVDTNSIIDEIARLQVQRGYMSEEQVKGFKMLAEGFSYSDLMDTIKEIRESARKEGLIDSTGKKVCS